MRNRILLIPIALVVVLAGLTAYMAFNHVTTLRESRHWERHTFEVLDAARGVFSLVQDAENGQRGFLLTRDETYLEPFEAAVEKLGPESERLRRMVRDNPDQSARAREIERALTLRMAIIERTNGMVRENRLEAARDLLETGRGKVQMDRIRQLVGELIASEKGLLAERQKQADAEEQLSFLIGLIFAAIALAGLAWAIFGLGRANHQLGQALAARDAAQHGQRESVALYSAVFANTADYVFVIGVGEDGRFTLEDLNPALEAATGLKADRMRGKTVEQLAPAPAAKALSAYYQRVVDKGAPLSTRDELPFPGGVTRIWESVLVPVHGEDGRIERIVGSARDVTEREAQEGQLRRAQRMEAVGQLTGGVAHDFNNLLQVIRANLELIEPAITDEKARRRLRNAIHGAERAADLTRRLLAFARRQPLEPQPINLGRLVGEVAELMRRTIGEGVEVETVIAGGLWNTLADPAQVESALLNLAINARDAMPGGGRLTVEVANAALDDDYARQEPDVKAGQYVMLAVSDSGAGMSPETLARVFEPFFSTKGEGRGTGLGLSMVYGFVKQSGGHIKIYSEPGQGTTVKLYLPRTRKAAVERTATQATAPAGRGQTILVVEDEQAVREAAVAMLTDMGFSALQADGPESALAILNGDAAIDLMFTDVIMPGAIKTRDFAARAQTLRPGLPVLYTSGYTENAIVHHGRLDEGVNLLSKPYGREALARKVMQALGGARPTVLLVEDDALIREAAAEMIAALGYAVEPAGDGPGALAVLEGAGRVDVLFTDLGLPGMNGRDLAAKALALRPDLRIVFATGELEPEDGGGAAWLTKPYDAAALARVIGRIG
ncbi:CHASE3 domain-containing protein [Caulobacter sp. NIBR1757]|uniref:CHASE3 domain-containing protein n=1 Tax=Caulobacter sp. NIBR1757 TaxID=3016000 RepID=UPI0022F0F131|nr:CHASE3 domain-containing protein [Caulobacter sp. NIBR1757]WGM40248.1 Sensor histidine kinase RcsC [Caulobacter sp. NIBR1757]